MLIAPGSSGQDHQVVLLKQDAGGGSRSRVYGVTCQGEGLPVMELPQAVPIILKIQQADVPETERTQISRITVFKAPGPPKQLSCVSVLKNSVLSFPVSSTPEPWGGSPSFTCFSRKE